MAVSSTSFHKNNVHLFAPGKSGNPGGRTSEEMANVRHARRLASEAAPSAVCKLIELMSCGKPDVEKAAADSILDRAGVKVIKGVELGDPEGNSLGYIVVPAKRTAVVPDGAPEAIP
jgi:hypothetical protein